MDSALRALIRDFDATFRYEGGNLVHDAKAVTDAAVFWREYATLVQIITAVNYDYTAALLEDAVTYLHMWCACNVAVERAKQTIQRHQQ